MRLDKERMRRVRHARRLSQAELGRRLGTSQGRIAVIEGGASITPETAEKVASALVCSVNDLVAAEEPVLQIRLSDLSPQMLEALTSRQTKRPSR